MVQIPEVGSTKEENKSGDRGTISLSVHNGSGFCYVPTCLCKEIPELIRMLGQAVQHGLASPADADRIYQGRTV